ncbi:ATP-binding protein [Oscillospiraceae bacterium PP1C4]
MKNLTVTASTDELDHVLDFINVQLEAHNCSMKAQMQIAIAVEEIFVNIAHYAYCPVEGDATVCCEIEDDPLAVTIQFLDGGKPYNPLAKSDPDTSLSAEERIIGGLGIFMVKKSMDDVRYEYKGGKNVLTIKKKCN